MPKSPRKTTGEVQDIELGQTRKTTNSERTPQDSDPSPRDKIFPHTGHGKQRTGVKHSRQLKQGREHQKSEVCKLEIGRKSKLSFTDKQSRKNEQTLEERGREKTKGRGENEKTKERKGKRKPQPEKTGETQRLNLRELKTSEKECDEKRKEKDWLKTGIKKTSGEDLEKHEGTKVSKTKRDKVNLSTGKDKGKKNKVRRCRDKRRKETFSEVNDSSKSGVEEEGRGRTKSRGISKTRPARIGKSRTGISKDPSESSVESNKEPNSKEESSDSKESITEVEDDQSSSGRGGHQRKMNDHSTESESTEEERDKRETGNEEMGKEEVTAQKDESSSGEDSEEDNSVSHERGSQSKLHSSNTDQNQNSSVRSNGEGQENKQGDSGEETDNEKGIPKIQVRSLEASVNMIDQTEETVKRRTLQMNVKKKLLVGLKVTTTDESKGADTTKTKQQCRSRQQFSQVQFQHKYQSRLCEAMKKKAAAKQDKKQGNPSGDELNFEKSTDVKTISPSNILAQQSLLIHSFKTKSRDISSRSKQRHTPALAESSLSQLMKVAAQTGKPYQGAPAQEKLTDETSKMQRSTDDNSDIECHPDEDETSSSQHLGALVHQKKIAKVVGKMKLASIKKWKTASLNTEENTTIADVIEPESENSKLEGNSYQWFPAIRKVTGWISRQIPKILKSRSKLVTVTKVIGTTEWLTRTLSMRQKNRNGKPGGFRRRMAIKLASTAGRVSQKGHSSGITNTDLKAVEEGAFQSLGVNNMTTSSGDAETMAPNAIELVPEMEANGQNKSHRSEDPSEVGEKFINSDAKYAIVLPRVHQLVKSKAAVAASYRSERASGDVPLSYKVAVSSQPDHLYMDAVRKPQSKYRDKLHTLAGVMQSNADRKTSKQQQKDARLWSPKNIPRYEDMVTSPRLANKLLKKQQDKTKIALPERNSPLQSYVNTDPHRQITPTQDSEHFQSIRDIHWAQRGNFKNEHITWLDSETLLPHPTIENLSKWAMYKKQDTSRTLRRTGLGKLRTLLKTLLRKTSNINREVCESSVLLNLKRRFHRDIIYTYIGNILVSVNPYKHVGIYSEDKVKQYKRKELSENPPHIFALADAAYTLSQSCEREQCIIVSGQSGSGKTEGAKLITHYLTALYKETKEERICQVTEVFPILEAFGNAKTVLNNNSSRFGKLLWIHILQGRVVGTSISHYLLERSRLVFQAHNERNYHVFYELLAGLDDMQKQQLSLQESETYFYLNQGRACEITSKQEQEDFLCLLRSLGRIGLMEDQLKTMWSILSSILQLGNVCFTSYEDGSQELAVIVSYTEIRIVAQMLQISSDRLHCVITQRVTNYLKPWHWEKAHLASSFLISALRHKQIVTSGFPKFQAPEDTSYDRIFSPLSVEGSIDARDSIAKALYSVLFDWLVQQINHCLMPVEMDSSVGIVDVYGFEDLGVNSFEQLCINYANEQLQHFFSQAVLTQEQEEYSQEQIDWAFIPVSDRQNCLDLITAKPHGILRILDDQTNLPQATDHTFLQKCHYQHSNNPWYVKPKLPLPVFTVRHYAGPVTYQVHKFLDKNHDQLRPEVIEVFMDSRNKMISDLFKRAQQSVCQQNRIGSHYRGHRYQSPTVATKFQQSLLDLINKLKRCNPFFIRCIKPNIKKIPGQFDVECVGAQLRHSGIMEVVHIRKEGYPVRILLPDFISRYSILLKGNCSDSDVCSSILEKVTEGTPELYQLGLTKVFLKNELFNQLENCWRKNKNWAALTIQKNVRGFINRKNFQIFKQKIVIVQSHIRGHQARIRYKRLKRSLERFGTAVVISRAVAHRRRNQLLTAPWNRRIFSRNKGRGTAVGMDVGLLEIPAELAALLEFADRHSPAFENQVAEVSPPQVKANINNSLPADVNNYPFSKFINQHFKVPQLQVLNQPLQQPLTYLEGAEKHAALELFKLVLRFLQAEFLYDRKEILLGNFIAHKGISNPTLRNEIFCQVVNQTWKNPDMENWQRACLLMATCLSCLRPSPELEKPLLKYVSDHTMEEYRPLCQHKALSAMQQTQGRAYPPAQLEWTANRRRGQMVLDIHLLNEDKVAAEVESWTTGEELANWILKLWNQENEERGWTVSMHNGEEWRDMLGCDFVMDLIAEVEQLGFFPTQPSTSVIHPGVNENSTGSHPSSVNCFLSLSEECEGVIPPAPNIQAPPLPPPFLSQDQSDMHSYGNSVLKSETSRGSFENYVDNLFDPVFSHGAGEMERSRDLNRRMKGGGGIGPSQVGAYMTTGVPMVPNYSMGVPAMSQMPPAPAYQTMPLMPPMQPVPVMQPMPAMQTVPMMQPMAPPMPTMMMPHTSVPQMAPLHQTSQYAPPQLRQPERQIDSSQLTAQQQTFINQQALLLAQQMTIQAMSISQQQQQERQQKKQEQQPVSETPKAPTPPKIKSKPVVPAPPQQQNKTSVKTEPVVKKDPPKEKEVHPKDMDVKADSDGVADDLITEQVESFQQKRDFFQKLEKEEPLHVKPPSKILLPKPEKPEKKKESEESNNSEVEEHKVSPSPANSTKDTEQKDKGNEKDHKTEEEKKEPEVVKSIQTNTRPEPSQNIREIIKLYQSQPKQPPPLYQPVRRSVKPFLKKNDPKDEALSLLGMRGSTSPTAVENGKETQTAKVPPKTAPKPQRHSQSSQRSIEDQLTKIYASPLPGLPLPPPPPPPPPGPSSSSTSVSEFQLSPVPQKREEVFLQDDNIKTHLYRRTASVYFSYVNIPWKLYLRKESNKKPENDITHLKKPRSINREMTQTTSASPETLTDGVTQYGDETSENKPSSSLFYPREKFNTEYILNLMCEQIIRDTYSDSCTRISKEERRKMRDLLAELHIGTDVRLLQDNGLKKRIVVAARDNWAIYFSRMFPVSGDIGSNVQILSISHRGIKLIKLVQAVGMKSDNFKILQSYSYTEILNVTLKEETMLEFSLKNEQLVLYSEKAEQAKMLITLFLEELQKDSDHVMAIKSYITDDKSLLNFRKGDIIKLLPLDGLEPGWQFGSIGGRSGLFPEDHAQPTAAPDYYNSNLGKNEERQKSTPSSNRSSIRKISAPSEVSENTIISSHSESNNPPSNMHSSPDFVQYVMTEFAMKYFRDPVAIQSCHPRDQSSELPLHSLHGKLGWKGVNAEEKNPNYLIQHTKIPIQESLINIPEKNLSKLAAKNFMALLRFMGDQPPQKHQSDRDLLQSILKLCKEKDMLKDEICCQIIKQITDNPIKENCTRGWRVLYLFLGYYPCTSNLRPFVQRYLEKICTDSNHDFQAIAMACQDNMYRTLKYGGRQHSPSNLELEAIIKGRSSRRIIVYLPGKLEHTAKIKPFMVGHDVVMEICANIGITDSEEAKEFSLSADRNNGEVVRPIKSNEYIFDFLLDDNSISLHFRRMTWREPLHFYNDLCVSVHYNQVLPIYLKGQLLFPKNIHGAEQQAAILAAYQHKTKGAGHVLNVQQLKDYLPKTMAAKLNTERVLKQTIQELDTMHELSPVKAKIQFLCEVKAMPLFGYNIFMVKKTSEHWIPSPCILAVNQDDLIILNENTKNDLLKIPLMEIQTMRSLHPTNGSKIREMEINFGSSIKPQTITFELKEAKEVCHIIAKILDELLMHSDS